MWRAPPTRHSRDSAAVDIKYLLKDFLTCGICGNGLTVFSCRQRDGSYVPAVACRARDDVHGNTGCGGVKRNLAPIDDLITRAVLFRLDSEQLAHRLRAST